ncbi:hypothetical protein [Anaeroselena agilis]|uniref:Uncharacterized protein n=1 Tax=Anaeroselena agilis TaxID=3063788 RepID=A0ABU3NV24_9FIRM|nr:hypothetical protein [Selenomonadales bacterium 4137-cl]
MQVTWRAWLREFFRITLDVADRWGGRLGLGCVASALAYMFTLLVCCFFTALVWPWAFLYVTARVLWFYLGEFYIWITKKQVETGSK